MSKAVLGNSTHTGLGDLRAERRTLIALMALGLPLFLVAALCLPNLGLVFRLFTIPSASMAPAAPVGSHIVVSRAAYGYSRYSFDTLELPIEGRWPLLVPQRGDVIAFRLPRDHNVVYVNRVVGLPGERIRMVGGRLSINGQVVQREPAPGIADPFHANAEVDVYIERLPEGASYRIIESDGDSGRFDNTPEVVVPEGHLFVLGDNRDNSVDSREASQRFGVGLVPIELVIGRVVATL